MTRLWLALSLSAGWLVAAPALAQSEVPPAPPVPASAAAAYQTAQTAYRDGDVAGALASMSEAYRISQRKELLYNLAELERELGHCPAALRDYRAYLQEAPQAKHRPKAEQASAALSVECPNPTPVSRELRPGPRLQWLSPAPAAPDPHHYWTTPRVLGWSAVAAGALASGAALSLTLAAKSARDDVQTSVDAQVMGGPHWNEQRQRDQHRDQTWAQISGIGAGAFIVGGALLVWFDPGRAPAQDGNLSVAFRPGGAEASYGRSF